MTLLLAIPLAYGDGASPPSVFDKYLPKCAMITNAEEFDDIRLIGYYYDNAMIEGHAYVITSYQCLTTGYNNIVTILWVTKDYLESVGVENITFDWRNSNPEIHIIHEITGGDGVVGVYNQDATKVYYYYTLEYIEYYSSYGYGRYTLKLTDTEVGYDDDDSGCFISTILP